MTIAQTMISDTVPQIPENLDGNSSLVTQELTDSIKQSVQPIMVEGYRRGQTFLAVGSKHGRRLMLQINVHATEIPTLLRSRSVSKDSNDSTSGKNRPVNEEHVKTIKSYIIERAQSNNKWIIGTITANVSPTRIQYQKIWGDIYVVFIPNNTSLEITDGQHRKKAITQLIESDDIGRDLIADATFPVNLVLEGNLEQCQTDFCDMAQTYPIAKSLLVSYAGFGKDGVAKEVAEKVGMFKNKTQKIKSTPGSGSKYIYTINYIAKLVSCAFSGTTNDKLTEFKTHALVTKKSNLLSECLNHFFSIYPLTQGLAEKEDLDTKDATAFRENNILGISVGLEILGLLLYKAYDDKTDTFEIDMIEQLADDIDWSKSSDLWKGTVVVDNGKEGEKKGVKISASRSSVSVALDRCIQQLGW
ncbi:MAG: DNA sulfur modification protein DndB [Cyanobacteria bacterium J06592_8]